MVGALAVLIALTIACSRGPGGPAAAGDSGGGATGGGALDGVDDAGHVRVADLSASHARRPISCP
jgi:hypothetical protein